MRSGGRNWSGVLFSTIGTEFNLPNGTGLDKAKLILSVEISGGEGVPERPTRVC
jgi:hypothetical protein